MGMMEFTKAAIRNLLSTKDTKLYPLEEKKEYELTRGHIEIEIDKCIFCGLCSRKCPTSAIKVSREEKSWQIDRLRCIQCEYCSEICPKKCLSMENEYTKPTEECKEDKYIK